MKKTVAIQTRMTLAILLILPLIWIGASVFAAYELYEETFEINDTHMSQLARRLLAVPLPDKPVRTPSLHYLLDDDEDAEGEAKDKYMAFQIWNAQGDILLHTRGAPFIYSTDMQGFYTVKGNKKSPYPACNDDSCIYRNDDISFFHHIAKNHWRVLYLTDPRTQSTVAVAQNLHVRMGMVYDTLLAQMVPWIIALLLLLILMTIIVRRSLGSLKTLAKNLDSRQAGDDSPLSTDIPEELQPPVRALNQLLKRNADAIAREQRFTSDAAHELRSPLAALKVQTEVLMMSTDENEKDIAAANLKNSIDRAGRLIEQLLIMARIDPLQSTQGEIISWTDISEKVLHECNIAAREKRIRLQRKILCAENEILPIRGDAVLLSLMLRNLIDNAIRYSPENSEVLLQMDKNSVCVSDEGRGIAPEWLPKIRERFVRPPGQKESGSGLGLSIVERIADLHGLQLILQNRSPVGLTAEIKK